MPIRIMHVTDHLGKGGLENGLVNLIEHLDRARFEHVVYAIRKLGPNADRLTKNRVRVICQQKQPTDSRFQMGTLARAIREIRPDIVHSRNWAAIEAVPAAAWVRSCKIVHSDHGLEADARVKEPARRIWFRRLSYHLADRVLSVSYQLRDLQARRTGFNPSRISVIHNGVDRQRFFPDAGLRERMRTELGILGDEFCIGCVGNFFPVKGHITALQAIEEMAAKCAPAPWRLLLIGEGPERAKLEKFVAVRPALKQRVAFLGTSLRVPEMLNAMDAYVLPSVSEGISNSLLEAMASGIPVIATATGGNPEVVVDGESGLLFPVGDSGRLTELLLRLRSNVEQRSELSRNALRRVQDEFSIEGMVGKYAQLYESLGRTAAIPLHAAAGV
jgi:sugar transferase (PEP-CTERM/EpsH1 system associated)